MWLLGIILGILTAPFYMVIDGSKKERKRHRNWWKNDPHQ